MIRILTMEDYEAYSTLRSLGLKTDPSSFWASEEEELPIRKDRFMTSLNHQYNFMIGHFESDELVCIAGFNKEEKIKLSHKGYIWGVYTHPHHRGKGIAKRLMQVLIDKAFAIPELNQINLSTGLKNHGAISLYEKLGFNIYGTEIMSSKIDGQFYDEVFMNKFKG